jgi:hypothetical protein
VKYNKKYTNADIADRLVIFKMNLDKIDRLNALNTTATFGINEFADLSEEEFKRYVSFLLTMKLILNVF